MRWRRNQLPDEIRAEVTPSNILMKGPTGTGKTEIARRLSTLAEAPFIKVEATRYTEVGFVGANTSDMIKGLMDNAVRLERELARKNVAADARAKAEMKVLDLLKLGNTKSTTAQQQEELRTRLRNGDFDHHTVRVTPRETRSSSLPSSANPLSDLLEGLDLGNINMGSGGFIAIERGPAGPGGRGGGRGGVRGGGGERQVVSVKKALERFVEEFEEVLTNEEEVMARAKHKAENYGIVFIDEIDKLCGSSSADAASTTTAGGGNSSNKGEGVQRELLTLVEGCSVPTRYGTVRTDFMLFIASGAFHHKSPSDLLPELQGRFPVRVALQPLSKGDLIQILSAKKFNILEQTKQLLATEGVELEFTACGIEVR
ncbi:atp-dependent protease, partial [Nannochloropsis oceanica]